MLEDYGLKENVEAGIENNGNTVSSDIELRGELKKLFSKLNEIEGKIDVKEKIGGKFHSVGIIAFKEASERVVGKNLRDIGGKPLYKHIIEKALNSKLDKVFVITNSEIAKEEIRRIGAEILEVPDWYFGKAITGDKMLTYPAELIDSDIYLQLFATAPFLTSETIDKSINILEETNHDSVFTVNKKHDWVWHNGRPITYYPGNLPRSQDAVPLMTETTGLYGMTKEALMTFKRRVGNNPFMLEVDHIEGWDIDEPLDFALAELFIDNIEKMKEITGKDYGILSGN